MALPYERAISGTNALTQIQKLLSGFGCQRFGHMVDHEKSEVIVQFNYRGREILIKASVRGYAAAYIKEHCGKKNPSNAQTRKATNVANVAVYSILRDWIKGQITAIEVGLLTFEGAFLGQIMLPTGKTILEHVEQNNILKLESK